MATDYKCTNCGSQVSFPTKHCANCSDSPPLTWETDIKLLSNPLIVKQLVLVAVGAGLMMAFLLSLVFASTGEFDAIPMIVLISFLSAIGLLVFLFLIALILFGNRTSVRFTVDEKGAHWETVDKRAKTLNRLTILAGILGSSSAAGAGTSAVARENEFVAWSQMALIEESKHRLVIILRNSWRPVMMLVCLPENFDTVLDYVNSKVDLKPATKAKEPNPFVKGLKRTILVGLAAAPLFYLSSSHVLDYDIFMTLLMFCFALATVWLVPFFGWVVIVVGFIVAIQLLFSGIDDFRFLNGYEQFIFFLSFLGLSYLVWFSWSYIKGKILPALMEASMEDLDH